MSYPDFFTEIAAAILGVGYMDVDKNTRRRVKYAIIQASYGGPINPFDSDPVRVIGTVTGRFQHTPRPRWQSLDPRAQYQ